MMLLVLARSHIHCLPAVVYIRIMHVVERKDINKINGEEFIWIMFMDI